MKQCKECGVDIVRRTFCSKKCAGQNRSKNTCRIDKDTLIKQYVTERLEVLEIANYHQTSVVTVFNYLRRYGVETRGGHIDFTGQKRGRLAVIEPMIIGTKGGGKHVMWKCKCDCGRECVTYSTVLNTCIFPQCKDCAHKSRRSSLELKNYMWTNIKRSAENRNIEFNVTREWAYDLFLQQNRKCALSGVDIGFAACAREYNEKVTTASLDRIDSSLGYTESNVHWVHKIINRMKGVDSRADFISWCQAVVTHTEKE